MKNKKRPVVLYAKYRAKRNDEGVLIVKKSENGGVSKEKGKFYQIRNMPKASADLLNKMESHPFIYELTTQEEAEKLTSKVDVNEDVSKQKKDLHKLKKDELIEKLQGLSYEVTEDMTKDDLVNKIIELS